MIDDNLTYSAALKAFSTCILVRIGSEIGKGRGNGGRSTWVGLDNGAVALRGWLPDGWVGGWIFGNEKWK
jgi:hypothetical protein